MTELDPAIDPAFEGAGQEPGIIIWRIEQMEVKPIPKSEYGNFYNGDSYIVLSTKGFFQTKSGRLEWDIHFWLGEETSTDEAGAAAIKAVELEEELQGTPVQHREVQHHESSLFLSYFKKGIRYLKGGVQSGFHHVEDVPVKRLLRVKGRRNVRLHEMPVEIGSLNKGDCFVLDSGPNVFLFVGAQSGRSERVKAMQAALAIRNDVRHGKSTIRIVDSYSSHSEIQEFFDDLGGGSLADVADESAGGDDAAFESGLGKNLSLHRIWEDDSGALHFNLVSEKNLKQENLRSSDCYVLDTGLEGLFVWIGKESSPKERREAMNVANKYIEKKNYPKWLHVKRIIHQGEPSLFKSYFSSWEEPDHHAGLGRTHAAVEEVDASSSSEGEDSQGEERSELLRKKRAMFSKSIGKACSFMPDDGSGTTEIWRVENFDIVPIEQSQHGVFFGGDSYIIKYTYNKGGADRHILYFWEGRDSSQDERAASAMMTVRIDNEQLFGKAIQVRVVQGHEPEHFLRIFKGKMVILSGCKGSGFKNIHDHDSYEEDGIRLFQVRGTNDYNTRAEQVPDVTSSLNSNDVFILETPSVTYLWIGRESYAEEEEMARKIIEIVSPDRVVYEVPEGKEPDGFWAGLRGKGDYPRTRELPSRPLLEPRLFKLSNETGKFIAEEICNFIQEDLDEDDVMFLDSGDDALFIWIGRGANDEEKQKSLQIAEEYIQSDPTDRSFENILTITVKQNEEPDAFKSYFGEWNPDLWDELSALHYRN